MLNKSLGNHWGIIGDSLKEDSLKSVAGGLGRISKKNAIILGAAIGAVVGFCTTFGVDTLWYMALSGLENRLCEKYKKEHQNNPYPGIRFFNYFGVKVFTVGITSSFGLAGGEIAKHLWQLYDKKSKKAEMKK